MVLPFLPLDWQFETALLCIAALPPCRGCSISVPHDIEGTLVRRYGPGWRTPTQVAGLWLLLIEH